MEYTFETYTDKDSYAYKVTTLFSERIEQKEDLFNPLYLYGDNERKREHLTTALIHAVAQNTSCTIVNISAEFFVSELIHAIQSCMNMEKFLQKFYGDLVIIRNLHQIIKYETASWELFRLVDYLRDNGSKIVFTTYASPCELVEMGFHDRYKSRATSGLVCNVDRQYTKENSIPKQNIVLIKSLHQKRKWRNSRKFISSNNKQYKYRKPRRGKHIRRIY